MLSLGSVTSSKTVSLSEPQFPHLKPIQYHYQLAPDIVRVTHCSLKILIKALNIMPDPRISWTSGGNVVLATLLFHDEKAASLKKSAGCLAQQITAGKGQRQTIQGGLPGGGASTTSAIALSPRSPSGEGAVGMGRMVDLWSHFFPLGTRNPFFSMLVACQSSFCPPLPPPSPQTSPERTAQALETAGTS